MKSIIDILPDQTNVCPRIGDILRFDRLEAFAIIGEDEDVLVGTMDIADFTAGATGVREHYAAVDATGEGAETNGGDVGGEGG